MNGRITHSKNKINEVFRKCKKIKNQDPNLWRKDRFGREIYRPAYGDFNSDYGWNIHHKNGNPRNNTIENLEAIHYDSHSELHN